MCYRRKSEAFNQRLRDLQHEKLVRAYVALIRAICSDALKGKKK
jgi:hypothetical protein